MKPPKIKRFFIQIIPFGIIFSFFSIIFSLLEKGILGDHPIYPSTGNPYYFNVVIPAVMAMAIGMITGVFEVFCLSKWFRKSKFLKKIIIKTVIYLLITVVTIFTILIFTIGHELREGLLDKQVLIIATNFFFDFAFWSIALYFTTVVVICLFYFEVSENLGQAVFLNFLTGKIPPPYRGGKNFYVSRS